MSDKGNTIKKKAIIESLKEGSSIFSACKGAEISRKQFYVWLKKDKKFAEEIEDAKKSRIHIVEDALYKKAIEGNLGAIIFLLCNRDSNNWKNPQRIEGTLKAVFDPTKDIEIKITPKDLE